MNKLEKSIRHEMKYFGPAIRTGHWGVAGYTTGLVPSNYRTLHRVCCDVDPAKGIVTDIRVYAYGDGMTPDDYYHRSVDITEPVTDYLTQGGDFDWDMMISSICDIAKSAIVWAKYPNLWYNNKKE